ncbi:hypothetical protein [Amycolatopsis sp. NPDC051903]|uniref:hypothetical protein n=1 Tax=Amycolatopsis sp. NPDC051903 TaxID=3363936 RepID=UPI003797515B
MDEFDRKFWDMVLDGRIESLNELDARAADLDMRAEMMQARWALERGEFEAREPQPRKPRTWILVVLGLLALAALLLTFL